MAERMVAIQMSESLVRHLAAANNICQVIAPELVDIAKAAVAKLPPAEPPLGTCVAWAKLAPVTGNSHRTAMRANNATKGWCSAQIEDSPKGSVAYWSWEDIWSDARPGTLRVLASDTEILN